ncbi:MAG: formylglycine-generating enzyme family protein [Desulfovibrio sp.]|uniref:formylglycine-generating enzyme family protein n=1 Tax=Desulfovibrio sp. 7SRBS1 TaxID=3378064 RepID=UPI003B3F1A50
MQRNRFIPFFLQWTAALCLCVLTGFAGTIPDNAWSAPAENTAANATGIDNLRITTKNEQTKFHFNVHSDADKALVVLAVSAYGDKTDASKLHMTGDLGLVTPGPDKTIIWDIEKDFPNGYHGPVSGEMNALAAWREPTTGMLFVRIPGDCYEMGCGDWNPVCDEDELPLRRECPEDFWMGVNEVTNDQFCKYLNAVHPTTVADFPGIERRGDMFAPVEGAADHAVGNVDWLTATAYARWLSDTTGEKFALPTESQWEYACRNQGRWNAFATVDGRIGQKIEETDMDAPLKETLGPNMLGLQAMSGGVWEWTENTYTPGDKSLHVLRSGRQDSKLRNARCANRYPRAPESTDGDTGFRLIKISH